MTDRAFVTTPRFDNFGVGIYCRNRQIRTSERHDYGPELYLRVGWRYFYPLVSLPYDASNAVRYRKVLINATSRGGNPTWTTTLVTGVRRRRSQTFWVSGIRDNKVEYFGVQVLFISQQFTDFGSIRNFCTVIIIFLNRLKTNRTWTGIKREAAYTTTT